MQHLWAELTLGEQLDAIAATEIRLFEGYGAAAKIEPLRLFSKPYGGINTGESQRRLLQLDAETFCFVEERGRLARVLLRRGDEMFDPVHRVLFKPTIQTIPTRVVSVRRARVGAALPRLDSALNILYGVDEQLDRVIFEVGNVGDIRPFRAKVDLAGYTPSWWHLLEASDVRH